METKQYIMVNKVPYYCNVTLNWLNTPEPLAPVAGELEVDGVA